MIKSSWMIGLILALGIALVLCGCAKSGKGSETAPEASATNENGEVEDFTATSEQESSQLKDLVEQLSTSARKKRREYLIGPGDILRVKVWMRDDLSKEGAVKDDGNFYLPLAGNVKADGYPLNYVQETITERLSEYLRDPQVDVEIAKYQSQVYYLVGEVREPGAYPITATTTIMEAITTGRGFSEKANLGEAYLLREKSITPVDFVGLFQNGRMENNIFVDDGDVIYIPSMDTARVYVMGEVLRPAAVPVRGGRISLAEAVAEAGGFNETTAYKRGIKIIRGSLTDPKVMTANFDDVLRGKRPDLAFLKPGDIVYVPSSGLTKWDRTLGQLLPSLSRIVVDAAAINSLTNK